MSPGVTTTSGPTTTTQVSSSPAPRPRGEDRRVNLAVTSNTASNQDTDRQQDKRKKGKKTHQKKQKQKKRPDEERLELGLEKDEAGSVGCLSICDTLILEVYQLLGGSLCSC